MSYSPVFYKEIILYFFLLLAWLAILAYIYLFLFFFPLCCILFIQISTPTQNTTFSPKKLKTASEDNSASNKSSGSVASSKKNNECSERLSEAQVSFIASILPNLSILLAFGVLSVKWLTFKLVNFISEILSTVFTHFLAWVVYKDMQPEIYCTVHFKAT